MCILREGFGWLGATQKLINFFSRGISWRQRSYIFEDHGFTLCCCKYVWMTCWTAGSLYVSPANTFFLLNYVELIPAIFYRVLFLILSCVLWQWLGLGLGSLYLIRIPSSSTIFTWTSSQSTWPIFFSKSIGISVVLQY